jgi:uncharacterized protein YndB with AHSA1/START domain
MISKNRLELSTPSDREVVFRRVFDAPRHLVFEAFTKPELLKRWLLGPPGWEMIECQVATKAGAPYRYVWRHADGQQFGIHGVCREFLPPERIASTELMDGRSGEAVVTTVLLENEGNTTLTMTIVYESKTVRDAALKSGMEHGVEASYERLEGLLAA